MLERVLVLASVTCFPVLTDSSSLTMRRRWALPSRLYCHSQGLIVCPGTSQRKGGGGTPRNSQRFLQTENGASKVIRDSG